jgi:hypothetical protein
MAAIAQRAYVIEMRSPCPRDERQEPVDFAFSALIALTAALKPDCLFRKPDTWIEADVVMLCMSRSNGCGWSTFVQYGTPGLGDASGHLRCLQLLASLPINKQLEILLTDERTSGAHSNMRLVGKAQDSPRAPKHISPIASFAWLCK